MKLNLHVIKEELTNFDFEDSLCEPASMMNITDVFLCTGPIRDMQTGILYITRSEYLQERKKVYRYPAIICIGEPPIDWLDSDINIIYTKKNSHIDQIYKHVSEIFRKYRNLEEKLQTTLETDNPFDHLSTILSGYIQNPLSILNSSYDVLFQYIPKNLKISEKSSTVFDFFYNEGKRKISNAEILMLTTNSRYRGISKTTYPSTLTLAPFNATFLIQNIRLQEELIGCVELIEIDAPIKNSDYVILVLLSNFLKKIFKRSSSSITSNDNMGQILYDIIAEKEISYSKMNLSMNRLNWDNYDEYVCLLVALNNPVNTILPNIRDYIGLFALGFQSYSHTSFDDYLIIVCNLTKSEIKRDKLLAYLHRNFNNGVTNTTVSITFSPLSNIGYAFSQSRIISKIGAIKNPKKNIHKIEDYYKEYFMYKTRKNQISDFLVIPPIKKLWEIDQRKGTSYIETLSTYLDNERNIADTARALYVHRNTLLYQLEKIKEYIGTDLNDPNERLVYQISLKELINPIPDVGEMTLMDIYEQRRNKKTARRK